MSTKRIAGVPAGRVTSTRPTVGRGLGRTAEAAMMEAPSASATVTRPLALAVRLWRPRLLAGPFVHSRPGGASYARQLVRTDPRRYGVQVQVLRVSSFPITPLPA